jgi:hypothetical protein
MERLRYVSQHGLYIQGTIAPCSAAIRLSYNTQPSLPLIYTVVILSTLFLHTHPYNSYRRIIFNKA